MKLGKNTSLAVAVTGAVLLLTETVNAQPKPGYSPSSTHIFPAGGRRGTTVNVRVGAECIPPGTNFELTAGSGVAAAEVLGEKLSLAGEPSPRRKPVTIPITYPTEWPSVISIADDAPLGPVFWRLSCAQGGTGSRPFIVGELPEFIETESNSTLESSERITLPVTVNGQIHGERDVDYFRFTAEAGDVVVCDVVAGRLGSRLDPIVEFLDATGGRLQVEQVHVGSDPVLALRVESPGEYLIRISNVTVHGDPAHVYRINVSTAPYVRYAFPAGGQSGSKQEIGFYCLSGTGEPNVLTQQLTLPSTSADPFTADEPYLRRFLNQFVVDELPNVVEREANDSPAAAEPLSLPVTVNGRNQTRRDEDWFRFSAKKGAAFTIRCRAYPVGTSALPTLLLSTVGGKQLTQSRSIEVDDGECRIEWTAPDDGNYLIRVRDLQHGARGGSDFIYRLSVRPAKPGFEISAPSDSLNVVQAGKSELQLSLKRLGGFDGPVQLFFDGLPDGVSFDTKEIAAGQDNVKLSISAGEDVPSGSFRLGIVGQATLGDRQLRHTVRAKHLAIDNEGASIGSPIIEWLHVTILHKPLFRLYCSEAYQYAYRGSVYPYLMKIERLDGFNGEIVLQIGDRQNRDLDGIEMREVTFPSGQTETTLPIYLPETMHINVQSQSQLYSQAYAVFVDKDNRRQAVLVLSEKRNMLRTLPPVVKMHAVDTQISGNPGAEVTCRLRLKRTTNFTGPMELLLRDSAVKRGFTALPVRIDASQTDVEIKVVVPADLKPGSESRLKFRASGRLDRHIIVTEASVRFRSE